MGSGRKGRREFLRLAGLGALGALVACRGGGSAPDAAATTPESPSPSPSPSPTARGLAWRRVPAAGPSARRDYSLVAHPDGGSAFLFGGRAGSGALGDLWVYRVQRQTWERVAVEGPSPRFGASAAFVGGRLLVFGGQGGPGRFFDDLWSYDPAGRRWTRLSTPTAPAARYGAGGAALPAGLLVSHGFTDSGRFDDTWIHGSDGWSDASPRSGPRPVKRCLHRTAWLQGSSRAVLFGGQTDGTPFLGDTWLYDPARRSWTELEVAGPRARNLYGAASTANLLYVYGGNSAAGPVDDLWRFDGARWRRLSPAGETPGARGGIEAAIAGDRMLVFGGNDGSRDLDDLWELTPV